MTGVISLYPPVEELYPDRIQRAIITLSILRSTPVIVCGEFGVSMILSLCSVPHKLSAALLIKKAVPVPHEAIFDCGLHVGCELCWRAEGLCGQWNSPSGVFLIHNPHSVTQNVKSRVEFECKRKYIT